MAWKPVRKVGDFIFNIPKEEYIAERFITSWSEHGEVARPSTYFDSYYMEQPINNYEVVFYGSSGAIVKLLTLSDGKYIGLTLNNFTKDQYNCFTGIQAKLYNADGSLYSNKLFFNKSYDIYNEYYPGGGKIPFYFSFVINEEEQRAVLSLLGSYGSYSWGCYFTHGGANDNSTSFYSSSEIYNIFKGSAKPYDPDPWSSGGYGDIGGGDGELDLSSDVISLPDLPTSFVNTGFIQIFAPTLPQINDLSNYMWNSTFVENFLKLFSNPMDIIVGLSMYPFTVAPAGTRLVHAGNILTTVQMNYPSSQYVTIDCGSIEVKHFYDAYVDYDPYTTCKIYLPYIGVQQLCMDDIMGKTIHVIYRVDLLTGVCAAYILCSDVILYTFSGECSAQIPISGQSFQSIVQSAINIATTTALGAHATKNTSALENGARSAASSLAGNVMSMKPDVSRSGSISSNVGMLGPQKPYLIFSVPRTCLPKGQNKYLGYPIFMTVKLSELKGYTEVENLWLNNMTCTEEEKKEIEDLLKGGVIL